MIKLVHNPIYYIVMLPWPSFTNNGLTSPTCPVFSYLCANQTAHEEVVRMYSWTTLSAQMIHSRPTFAIHVPSSRDVLIENTLKCPCLNRSSRGTPKIKCAFIALIASHLKGWEVPHASADGDRLFNLMALGVADEGGASVLVGYHNTF